MKNQITRSISLGNLAFDLSTSLSVNLTALLDSSYKFLLLFNSNICPKSALV